MLGKYELLEELGSGSQATVYRAKQPGLDREVAIKVVHLAGGDTSEFLARFEQEAQVAARLEHPNILPVHDYGKQVGCAYFVMRLVRGGTLAQRMKQGRVPDDELLRIVEQIAAALDFAHARSVVHRDVKPANILLSGDGLALLADFGIAKLLEGSALVSQPGMIACTPHYASPDPLSGEPLDGRSDQYSLAVVAYELLAGKRPFESATPRELLHEHAIRQPPFHGEWFAQHPAAVAVLRRALAKERSHRFACCIEFVGELRAALSAPPLRSEDVSTLERDALAPQVKPPPLPASAPPSAREIASPGDSSPATKGRGRGAMVVALGIAVLIAGIAYAGGWIGSNAAPADRKTLETSGADASDGSPRTTPPWTSFPMTITLDEVTRNAGAFADLPSTLSEVLAPALQRELGSIGLIDGVAAYDPNAAPEILGREAGASTLPTELSDRAFLVLHVHATYEPRPESNEPRFVTIDDPLVRFHVGAKLVLGGQEHPLCSRDYLQPQESPSTQAAAIGPTLRAHAEDFARDAARSVERELRGILELGVQRTFVIAHPSDTDYDLRDLFSQLAGVLDVQRVSDANFRDSSGQLTLKPLGIGESSAVPIDASLAVDAWRIRYRAPTAETLSRAEHLLREQFESDELAVDARRNANSDVYIARRVEQR